MARPIFVVGSMGSGTTLMRLMLDSHPNIMIAQETGFMRSVNAIQSIPFWHAKDGWIKRIGITRDELDRAIESFYDEVFGLAASKQGASRWGDKTPFHVEFIQAAARVFPDAVFVGTIRHPGAVSASMSRFGWDWQKGIRHWCTANEAILDASPKVGDRLRLWRYEDLVSDSEQVMREVLEFVQEPWDPIVLEHHRHQSGRAEGGTVANEPVDTSRVDKWRVGATDKDLRVLDRMAGPLASFFGYDAQQGAPVRPITGADGNTLGLGSGAWSAYATEIAAIPRRAEKSRFENSHYTQRDLADQLGFAYVKGRKGAKLRLPYRQMLPEDRGGVLPAQGKDGGQPEDPGTLASRIQRQLRVLRHTVTKD